MGAFALTWTQLKQIAEFMSGTAEFFANLITIVLGVAAVWTVYRRRDELRALFEVLLHAHFTRSASEIHDTLTRLEHVSFDVKEQKPQVRSLLGKLRGQLTPLLESLPELAPVHARLVELRDAGRMTEAKKLEIIYEVRGTLQNISLTYSRTLAKSVKNGS